MNVEFRRTRHLISAVALLACLLSLSLEVRAAWRAAGSVIAVVRETTGATLRLSSGARVLVTFLTPDVVRVRFAPRGVFERDSSYALASKDRKRPITTVREGVRGTIEIKTALEGARVVVRRSPFLITVYDAQGRVVVEDDPARPHSFDPGTGAVEASKKRAAETETYYGFGEKAMPASRHGQQMVMWNTDTYGYPVGLDPIYQAIGFFTALHRGRAYGLFLDNTFRTYFDMGKTDPARYTFGAAGGELNYYVFTGGRARTPRQVLTDYTDLTGRTPLPPLWALGYQQSRWGYYPEARVRELARRFRAERVPADVIYLDIDYMDGFRVFTWDKARFPDPARMLRDLRADGFRVVIIIDPGIKVDENYAVYREGRAGGHFHQTADGKEFRGSVWPGVCAFPDFTSRAAREWFGSYYRRHLDEGVAGFWNDMNEPATFNTSTEEEAGPHIYHHPAKTFPLDVRHAGDGMPDTHARYHNLYGMQMARSTFEGLKRLAPDARPFVLTRAGYAGVQRYSAVWTGDNVASWDHLRLSIPMLVNLGVSGVAFVGADVGGFSGADPSPELYTRWLQAAALTPLMRSHVESARPDREPWIHGEPHTSFNRATIELRYKLLPYLYTLFREHEETGAPVMRPLWFEYPQDARTYLNEDQFLVGRDLMVAPVVREGVTKLRVYFPKGDAWVDWWTGARYEGGKDAEVEAPIDRLPLFARGGAAVPVQPVIQHTGEMARAPLSLVVVPGAGAMAGDPTGQGAGSGATVSRVYEDAGEGYEYTRGAFRTLTVTVEGGAVRLVRAGSYNVSRPVGTVEMLGVGARPRGVSVGGREVENYTFDARTKRLVVALPAEGAEEILIKP